MASKLFQTLVERQVDIFINTFANDSNSIFKNDNNKLIHPGEYGMYRESCFRTLLHSLLSKEYKISDGFIFTAKDNHISTQCDILIHNADCMPISDNGVGKFFPVEDIYGVCEIKSNLTLSALKTALRKLAEVKMLGDDRRNIQISSRNRHQNNIPTFLICNKLDFNSENGIDFESIYEGIERKYWHNAILSLEDGLISYRLIYRDLSQTLKSMYAAGGIDVDNVIVDFQYSQYCIALPDSIETYDCPTKIISANPLNKYKHILFFLSGLIQAINECDKYAFDSIEYLGVGVKNLFKS